MSAAFYINKYLALYVFRVQQQYRFNSAALIMRCKHHSAICTLVIVGVLSRIQRITNSKSRDGDDNIDRCS